MQSIASLLFFSLFGDSGGTETILFGLFGIVIIAFLAIDLGFFNRKAHKVTTKSALYQSIFWVVISSIFGYLVYVFGPYEFHNGQTTTVLSGLDASIQYFSAYLTEKALSVDNIFVILLILKYFNVKEDYYHKILFWGIIGAVVFRAIFIFLGALLIHEFHWILYIFGVFLIYSGIRIYFEDEDQSIEPEKNPILKLCKKYLPMAQKEHGSEFVVREGGRVVFTSLFLVIVLIETTDLIFAVDSIPAAFAISQNEFIIYTSNIFAVMGLRAMFFLLSGIIDKFYLLQKGLSIILFFIGAKMLLDIWDVHLPPLLSFTVIIATLTLAIVFSILIPKVKTAEEE